MTYPATPLRSQYANRPASTRFRTQNARWLAVPAIAFVVALFGLPFLAVARVSAAGPGRPLSREFFDLDVFAPSNLTNLAGDPLFRSVLGVSLRLGLLVALVCTAIAVPYAAYIHRAQGWRKGALLAAVALPKLVNLLVLLYGLLLVLGRQGLLNQALSALGLVDRPLGLFGNLPAVVVTEVLIILPYPILVITAGFHSSDPRQYEAARSLGAGPVRAYLEAVVRPAAPALVGGALVAAIWGVGAFVGPLVMGNPPQYTVAVEVYTRALERVAWVDAAAWALLGTAAIAAVLCAVVGAFRLTARRMA